MFKIFQYLIYYYEGAKSAFFSATWNANYKDSYLSFNLNFILNWNKAKFIFWLVEAGRTLKTNFLNNCRVRIIVTLKWCYIYLDYLCFNRHTSICSSFLWAFRSNPFDKIEMKAITQQSFDCKFGGVKSSKREQTAGDNPT